MPVAIRTVAVANLALHERSEVCYALGRMVVNRTLGVCFLLATLAGPADAVMRHNAAAREQRMVLEFPDEQALSYFGYRYYSPRLGRWLSRDPMGEAGGLNLYAYCGNDPVNRHDYLGMDVLPVPHELLAANMVGLIDTLKGHNGAMVIRDRDVDIFTNFDDFVDAFLATNPKPTLSQQRGLERLYRGAGVGLDDLNARLRQSGFPRTAANPLIGLESYPAQSAGAMMRAAKPWNNEQVTAGDVDLFRRAASVQRERAVGLGRSLGASWETAEIAGRDFPMQLATAGLFGLAGRIGFGGTSIFAPRSAMEVGTSVPAWRFAEVRPAIRALRDAGLSSEKIRQAIASFQPGTLTTRTLTADEFAIRLYGGESGSVSPYLGPTFPGGHARELLAPSPGNTLQRIQQWRIPSRTTVLEGRVAPAWGQPGGGFQIYVPNPGIILEFP